MTGENAKTGRRARRRGAGRIGDPTVMSLALRRGLALLIAGCSASHPVEPTAVLPLPSASAPPSAATEERAAAGAGRDRRRVSRGRGASGQACIRPQRAVLFADDNANTEFQLLVWYRDGQASDEGILVLGTKRLPSSGYGSDSTSSNVDWQLFPDDAKAAAALFHVPRQERHPIATLVTGTFAPTQKTYTRAGRAVVRIVLTLANPATADAVKYTRGGRQRGPPRRPVPRSSLTRNGVPLAPIPAFNFGGLSSMLLAACCCCCGAAARRSGADLHAARRLGRRDRARSLRGRLPVGERVQPGQRGPLR